MALPLLLCVSALGTWDGDFYDPDDLKIHLEQRGTSLVAHSEDWGTCAPLPGRLAGQLVHVD